jgi:hypothetical protein
MNFSFEPHKYNGRYIYFTEPKQNTVIPNSTFIRIIYATPILTMTGIYLTIKLITTNVEKHFNTYSFSFDSFNEYNRDVIDHVKNIEMDVLSKWKTTKQPCYNISNQLESGHLSIWLGNDINDKKNNHEFILKISGVWENDAQNECGLTYKYL